MRQRRFERHGALPGFGLMLGYTVMYLSLIVLVPLAALFLKVSILPWRQVLDAIADPRAVASYRLTFGAAFAAALVNLVFGFVVAWTFVRYEFPGRKLLDAALDLPFALPTAVSGIALTAVYSSHGWVGSRLDALGIKAAFTPLGVVIALTFVGLPFVVRTLEPALEDLDVEIEEAALMLGASRGLMVRKVMLPVLAPSLLTGFAMAFARALGEYGSVIFISGNMPMKTEITSLLIVAKLEQFDYAGAASIAVLMLIASFLILLAINCVQWRATRRYAGRV